MWDFVNGGVLHVYRTSLNKEPEYTVKQVKRLHVHLYELPGKGRFIQIHSSAVMSAPGQLLVKQTTAFEWLSEGIKMWFQM